MCVCVREREFHGCCPGDPRRKESIRGSQQPGVFVSGYDVGQDEEARIVSWDGRAAKAEPSLPRVSPGDSASR